MPICVSVSQAADRGQIHNRTSQYSVCFRVLTWCVCMYVLCASVIKSVDDVPCGFDVSLLVFFPPRVWAENRLLMYVLLSNIGVGKSKWTYGLLSNMMGVQQKQSVKLWTELSFSSRSIVWCHHVLTQSGLKYSAQTIQHKNVIFVNWFLDVSKTTCWLGFKNEYQFLL